MAGAMTYSRQAFAKHLNQHPKQMSVDVQSAVESVGGPSRELSSVCHAHSQHRPMNRQTDAGLARQQKAK